MSRLLLVLVPLMVAAALVVGCDNQDDFAIRGGYLCNVVTNECEVLP